MKTVLVTGANAGLGKAVSEQLAREGHRVVMLCRDQARGEAALAEVKAAATGPAPELVRCDLSSPRSVKAAVKEVAQRFPRLDALLNNAAVYKAKREATPDGLETMFASNHLGAFALTTGLLEVLKASAPARVVNVAAPTTTKLDFEDLQGEKHFSVLNAFGASKMCNLLFNFELARRLEGSGVTANAVHPGLVKSTLLKENIAILRWIFNAMSVRPEVAAKPIARLLVSDAVAGVNGKFWKGEKQIEAAPYAMDPAAQRQLWEASEQLVAKIA